MAIDLDPLQALKITPRSISVGSRSRESVIYANGHPTRQAAAWYGRDELAHVPVETCATGNDKSVQNDGISIITCPQSSCALKRNLSLMPYSSDEQTLLSAGSVSVVSSKDSVGALWHGAITRIQMTTRRYRNSHAKRSRIASETWRQPLV